MTSLWDRLFGRRAPQEPRAAANDGREAVLADVRHHVRRQVAAGFLAPAEIVESAAEVFADELPQPELTEHARQLVEQELAAHAQAQAGWPAITDYDRLTAAFAALERSGIVMRQDFTCCGTCGSHEIWDEIEAFEQSGRRAYGYAFFHMQDTESAVDGDDLYLNYGGCAEGEEPALATARAVVAELERHGLKTRWNGSWDTRIAVEMDWKRRRPVVVG